MSNLDQAFLKAYAKKPIQRPSQAAVQSTLTPSTATPPSNAQALKPNIAPAPKSNQVNMANKTEDQNAASVVATRAASRSSSFVPSQSMGNIRRFNDNKEDSFIRIDTPAVQPAALTKPASLEPAIPAQGPARALSAQSTVKPLSQHQSSFVKTAPANSPMSAPTQPLSPSSQPAVYSYPSRKPVTDPSHQSPVEHGVVNKATLRKQAASSAMHMNNVAIADVQSTKNDTVYKSQSMQVAEALRHEQPLSKATAPAIDPSIVAALKDFDAQWERGLRATSGEGLASKTLNRPDQPQSTVRNAWRKDEQSYRVDAPVAKTISKVKEVQAAANVAPRQQARPPSALQPKTDSRPVAQAPAHRVDRIDAGQTTPPSSRVERQVAKFELPSISESDLYVSAASAAVVKSLADSAPKFESNPIYLDAKAAIKINKPRTDAKVAQATQSIMVPMTPGWEVDCFQWPLTVLGLLESQEEAFDEIASQLINANRKGLKVVAITAAERGVGKSTTTLCLAAVLANAGLRVAVIDGDTENPSLFNHLNLELKHGWQDCIKANVPLEDTAIHAIDEGITLFPLTDSIGYSEVEKNGERIGRLIKRVASSFDLVLVDSHRVNHKCARLIGSYGDESAIDAAMVIIDVELSVKDRVETSLGLLQAQGITSVGIVENFNAMKAAQ